MSKPEFDPFDPVSAAMGALHQGNLLAAKETQITNLKAELTNCKSEADRLKADVERLRKFNDEALAHIAKEERKSRERLDIVQAEADSLIKAGDAMYEELGNFGMTWPLRDAWIAAKERNQS